MASTQQQQDIDMSSGGGNLHSAGQQQPQQQPQQQQEGAPEVQMRDASRDPGSGDSGNSGGAGGAVAGGRNTSAADVPRDRPAELEALIASVADPGVRRALQDNKAVLLQEKLTTADDLQDATDTQLKDIGIPLGDRNKIKKTFQSAGARSESVAGPDLSAERAVQLISPALPSLPAVNDLVDLLFPARHTPRIRLPVPVPVTQRMLARLQLDPMCHQLLPYFTEGTDSHELADLFTRALTASVKGHTQPFAADLINQTVVAVLQQLDMFAGQQVGIEIERDKGDSVSGMTLLTARLDALRSDGVIRHSDHIRMLLKWEEKGQGDMPEAVENLRKKTAAWPEVYYGMVPYLLAFGQAGTEFQFYVLERAVVGTGGSPSPVGPMLRLQHQEHRAHLVLAIVQLYRYLKALTQAMPTTVAPLGKLEVHKQGGITRSIFYEALAIDKAITPWTMFSFKFGVSLANQLQVYAAAQHSPHLVHGVPAVEGDTYFVQLSPVGITPTAARPANEEELACAVKGGLTGLQALHQGGFVHRDVRGQNFTCNPGKSCYFWLDLELCGAAGKPCFHCQHWDVLRTLVDGQYVPQSDLYDFGVMVSSWAGCVTTPEGGTVVQLLQVPARHQDKSAQDLLLAAQPWFAALGV